MACSTLAAILAFLVLILGSVDAPLFANSSYSGSCPQLVSTVQSTIIKEPCFGASLISLFFHDCFVNGCIGSILNDDTSSFTGDSACGCEVIDKIKSAVEKVCPGIVSCGDILAIAVRDSVVLGGGHAWHVKLRRDAISFASTRKSSSPNLAPLHLQTPASFDNNYDDNYFKNLVQKKGLLHSDQQPFNGVYSDSMVCGYSTNPGSFCSDFVSAVIKMGHIIRLNGSNGEIKND